MQALYHIDETSEIITPALVVFREILEQNITKMIDISGDAARLRPHCKTHKTREVTQLQLDVGITKHKCATIAEAEMLATTGVKDICLAYNLVGANIERAVHFIETFRDVHFSVTADHPTHITLLSKAMHAAGRSIDVLLDIDTGQHRTGVTVGRAARDLYQLIEDAPGLNPGGLHIYDGHQHQTSRDERAAAIDVEWERIVTFRDDLLQAGFSVERIVAGGTASFPVYAAKDVPGLELSPGTCVFQDAGYGERFPDLQFVPAALLLTRVISRPTADRVTLDLGYKAVASDPPAGQRLRFPDLPQAEQVLQNEEHLVLQTPLAAKFQPGDELLAIPRHICPTTALHRQVYVVASGKVAALWDVAARDRWLNL